MNKQIHHNLMYTIVNNLEKINAPIAVKGGLLVYASLLQYQSPIDRATMDIDMNWINNPPSMEKMRKTLEEAVKLSYPDFTVEIKREYGDHRSAGFQILNAQKQNVTHVDIDINKKTIPKSYNIDDLSFQGVPIEQVLCDKIKVISSPQILRRSKDLIDVYAIKTYIPYDKNELTKLLSETTINDFSTLKNEKEKIKQGYNKLRNINNKPDFETIYQDVRNFCLTITNEIREKRHLERSKQAENMFSHLTNSTTEKQSEQQKTPSL